MKETSDTKMRRGYAIRCLALSCAVTLFSSCIFLATLPPEREFQEDVPIKWQGKNTGIRNLLDIDGFFCESEYIGDSCVSHCNDSPLRHSGMAFLDDGTYVRFDSKKKKADSRKYQISIHESGVYELSHDTIVVEVFVKMHKMWHCRRIPILKRFKIVDRGTIEEIDGYDLYRNHYINKPYIRSLGKYVSTVPSHDRTVGSFSDSFQFPTSDISMKERSWLWKSERDWKMWMIWRAEHENDKKAYNIRYDD